MPLSILLLAFALRIYLLDNQSFAFDEGWTSYAIHYSWPEMWDVLAPDNHPPLYYLLVKAFADLAGYGDFPVRFFSVMCGMVLIAGIYALGQDLGGQGAGLAAALFAAFLPSLVYYAQEARMYSLLMALGVLSSYCLVRMAREPRRPGWWIGYVLTMAGALYTQYFALLLVLAHNVAVLIWALGRWLAKSDRLGQPSTANQIKWWGLGQLAIGVLYLPWLPVAIQQVRIGQGTWWRIPLPAHMILTDIWLFWILGPNRPLSTPPFGPLTASVAVAVLAFFLLGWQRRVGRWAFALSMLILPVAVVVWAGSRWPVYTDRYTLVAAPGLPLAAGMAVAACWNALSGRRQGVGRVTALCLLALTLLGPLPQLDAYFHNSSYWREDFRRAAQYVMDTLGEGDVVILVGSYQPIMQYYQGKAAVLRFPQQGDSVQSDVEAVEALNRAIRPESQVKVVMYSWPTVDPQGLIEGMLRAQCLLQGEHWQRETGQRPIKVMNFEGCAPFEVESRRPVGAVWGDQVALTGYRSIHVTPGQQAHVFLWWQAVRRPDKNLSTFVHLMDAHGQVITQYDHLPLSDFYPMRAWPLNVPLRDDYPLNIPPQASLEGAWLAVGVYDRTTMQRLPVVQDGVPAGDFIRLPASP